MKYHIKQDSLWKGIIEDLFEDFLLYFFPDWAQKEVDFNKGFEFLDKSPLNPPKGDLLLLPFGAGGYGF